MISVSYLMRFFPNVMWLTFCSEKCVAKLAHVGMIVMTMTMAVTVNALRIVENVIEVELETGSTESFTMRTLVSLDVGVVMGLEGLVEVLEEVVVVEVVVLVVLVEVRVAAHVVHLSLLRIGQHLVGCIASIHRFSFNVKLTISC